MLDIGKLFPPEGTGNTFTHTKTIGHKTYTDSYSKMKITLH